MTSGQWVEFGKVLVTWGTYAMLYGAVTIVIGLTIVLAFSEQTNKLLH